MRYDFSILRFVPDTLRGEFVNLGVIVGSDQTGEWDIRLNESYKRARRFDTDDVIDSAVPLVVDLGRKFDEYNDAIEEERAPSDPISIDWLRDFASQSRNLLQVTPPSVISADNINEALSLLFRQFVFTDEIAQRATYIPRSTAVADMARAYRQITLSANNLGRRAEVASSRYAETFDFVVANGRAVQLTEAFSFALSGISEIRQRVKAWSWTVYDIRENGGTAQLGNRKVGVSPDVDIEAIVVVPQQANAAGIDAFQEAQAAFETNHVHVVPLSNVGEVARKAAELLWH
jgi:hypothetical protein